MKQNIKQIDIELELLVMNSVEIFLSMVVKFYFLLILMKGKGMVDLQRVLQTLVS